MQTFTRILVGIVCIYFFTESIHWVEGAGLRCPPVQEPNGPEPENCIYGIVTDYCGRSVCAKGPGESCGAGRLASMIGECGDGMFCRCGRCHGCSLDTLKCFHRTCLSP